MTDAELIAYDIVDPDVVKQVVEERTGDLLAFVDAIRAGISSA